MGKFNIQLHSLLIIPFENGHSRLGMAILCEKAKEIFREMEFAMIIAGIQPNSFVDYPGRIAYVIFTPGCNFNCYYCHNRHILHKQAVQYHNEYVLEEIQSRRKLIDGVVISGGEPTLQRGLKEFITRLDGLPVKLDTNGTRPEVIEELIPLLDYIAMDIKAPLEKYPSITKVETDAEALQASIALIMKSGVQYEFRTTMVPELTPEDIGKIAQMIQGAQNYSIQQYVPVKGYAPAPDYAHSKEILLQAQRAAEGFVKRCRVKNAG